MAKDGEVKILRDKLKRLEQDTQRMRTERVDLIKKLQTQKEEEKKGLQKQIELKELENQFKYQEIMELTMKCKQLESNSKKSAAAVAMANSNSVATPNNPQVIQVQPQQQQQHSNLMTESKSSGTPSTPTSMPPPNKVTPATASSNQLIIGSKGVPTKRMICQTSMSSLNGLSDTENENPTHENKRQAKNI